MDFFGEKSEPHKADSCKQAPGNKAIEATGLSIWGRRLILDEDPGQPIPKRSPCWTHQKSLRIIVIFIYNIADARILKLLRSFTKRTDYGLIDYGVDVIDYGWTVHPVRKISVRINSSSIWRRKNCCNFLMNGMLQKFIAFIHLRLCPSKCFI